MAETIIYWTDADVAHLRRHFKNWSEQEVKDLTRAVFNAPDFYDSIEPDKRYPIIAKGHGTVNGQLYRLIFYRTKYEDPPGICPRTLYRVKKRK